MSCIQRRTRTGEKKETGGHCEINSRSNRKFFFFVEGGRPGAVISLHPVQQKSFPRIFLFAGQEICFNETFRPGELVRLCGSGSSTSLLWCSIGFGRSYLVCRYVSYNVEAGNRAGNQESKRLSRPFSYWSGNSDRFHGRDRPTVADGLVGICFVLSAAQQKPFTKAFAPNSDPPFPFS